MARFTFLLLALVGCSSVDQTWVAAENLSGETENDEVELGSVEFALQLGDAISLEQLAWRIEGNGFSDSGEFALGRRSTAVARLGGIPEGDGYTLTLSSNDPAMRCSGSATFGVRRASTTAVRVDVRCTLTQTTGQVTVTAAINVCPVVSGLSAVPLEIELGETAQLWAEAQDIDGVPRRMTVRWERDGSPMTGNGLEAALTCSSVGQTTIRVVVSDGACDANAAVVLQCIAFQVARTQWPGMPNVALVDPLFTFPENLSGATYVAGKAGASGTLWVVQNGPSRIMPLFPSSTAGGVTARAVAAEGAWRNGKLLTYPSGSGEPDSEGITFAGADDVVYVASERDNAQNTVSRLSVLRYELESDPEVLTASHEWNVTAQLPRVGANLGLEAITWISDQYLVDLGFFDERTGTAYAPSTYPTHGEGLFFVGVEADGMLHAFALNHDSSEALRIASFSSGHPRVMGLEFDRDTGKLWTACDDGCAGEMTVLRIQTGAASASRGRFQMFEAFGRPSGMPNLNNEGLALAPESECDQGMKPIFWVDDGSTAGHSVRGGLMPCGLQP